MLSRKKGVQMAIYFDLLKNKTEFRPNSNQFGRKSNMFASCAHTNKKSNNTFNMNFTQNGDPMDRHRKKNGCQ